MTLLEVALSVALGVTMVVLLAFLYLYSRERRLRTKKQSQAFSLGKSQMIGDYAQILGTFSMLTEYESLITLSTTSAQSSLDLIGLKGDQLDFLEFKKVGTSLSKSENKLRRLIDGGQLKVCYKVIDVKLPDGTEISARD